MVWVFVLAVFMDSKRKTLILTWDVETMLASQANMKDVGTVLAWVGFAALVLV